MDEFNLGNQGLHVVSKPLCIDDNGNSRVGAFLGFRFGFVAKAFVEDFKLVSGVLRKRFAVSNLVDGLFDILAQLDLLGVSGSEKVVTIDIVPANSFQIVSHERLAGARIPEQEDDLTCF